MSLWQAASGGGPAKWQLSAAAEQPINFWPAPKNTHTHTYRHSKPPVMKLACCEALLLLLAIFKTQSLCMLGVKCGRGQLEPF